MKKTATLAILLALCLAIFVACDAGPSTSWGDLGSSMLEDNYQYEAVIENDFVSTDEQTTSYFSLDRNTASYSLMRRQIEEGRKVSADSVRLEEYVNYFNYDYVRPTNGDALALGGTLFDCPWNSEHKLLTISVAAEEVQFDSEQSNHVVFLIDTSGSMYGSDRLGLIQQSLTMLLDTLEDTDTTISIVTYAGDSRVALEGESVKNHKTKIAKIIEDLEAKGSTNGAGGIQTAYGLLEKSEADNKRVVLCTDGDFNVGVSSKNGLEKLISEKRESGIYLSVLGVGMFNTNDTTMETLARNGNGNYAYLDSVAEARKVLVEEFGGTFNVVAKDAKMGVEFNKDTVSKFRLIGYDTKLLSQEQFEDEATDAGEIGSGHTVTAVYELELKENAQGNVATAEVKYKEPVSGSSKSVSVTYTMESYTETPSDDCVFIGCVVEFGLLLRQSKYKADASFGAVLERLQDISDYLALDEFKDRFVDIVSKASSLYEQ